MSLVHWILNVKANMRAQVHNYVAFEITFCFLISQSLQRLPGALGGCIQQCFRWSGKGFVWQGSRGYFDSQRSTGVYLSCVQLSSLHLVNVCCIIFCESCLSISGCGYPWHVLCYVAGMEEIMAAEVKFRERWALADGLRFKSCLFLAFLLNLLLLVLLWTTYCCCGRHIILISCS